MNSISVLEDLLYKHNDLRGCLNALGVINHDRQIESRNHLEFKNILRYFEKDDFLIVSIVNIIQVTYIISPENVRRKTKPVIKILGYNADINFMSKNLIIQDMNSILNLKDFLPPAFTRKIIYIPNFKNMDDSFVFSEFRPNIWTLDDPMILPVTNFNECGGLTIISELMNNFVNGE